jgi:CubicO group peptidase (beta-lactamase class C family)
MKTSMRALGGLLVATAVGLPAFGRSQAPGVPISRPMGPALRAMVDRYFAPIVANHDFSGNILIARGGEILLEASYGMADPELGVSTATSHRYRIASLTKSFTAAAIVMLAERQKLALTDSLHRFLPEFPNARNITILQLLRHEAGLANPHYREALKERIDLRELVRRIGARPPLFAPGKQSAYSNAGFNLLARVIEVASGTPYDAFLQQNIFGPLGMTASGSFADDAIVAGRLRGFLPGPPAAGVIPAPWSDPAFSIGSGSIVSTTRDLHRWAVAVHEERLFKRSALPYPYGWGRLGADRRGGLTQSGLANGFTSSLDVWFSDSLYVIVLGNIESARWNDWSTALTALARGDAVSLTPLRREVPLSPQAAERFVGEYATADHTVVIEQRGGSLWLLLDGWPVRKYLAPIGANEFELRADLGRITFDTSGSGPAPSLAWIFSPESRSVYPRRK